MYYWYMYWIKNHSENATKFNAKKKNKTKKLIFEPYQFSTRPGTDYDAFFGPRGPFQL